MRTIKTRKQLYYKQAKFSFKTSDTLQNLVEQAVKKLKAADRHESIYEANTNSVDSAPQEWLRLINSPRSVAGFQCGTLVSYSPGMHHMVIAMAGAHADELDVSKFPPPDGKRFIEAPLYFAIRDNHLVLLQSMALRVDAFESHLNWLLQKSGSLNSKESLSLSDAIPKEIQKKITKKAVKKITLQSPFFDSQGEHADESESFSQTIKSATGKGLDILKGLIPNLQYEKLVAKDLTEVRDIQLNLEIKVTGRKRTEEHGGDTMRTLMDALRHVDNPDIIRAEIEGIGTVKGSQLRVHDYRNIRTIDGVLDTADTYETMCSWFVSLVDNNQVSSD